MPFRGWAMKIESFSFGMIRIDGREYRFDLKLIGDRLIPNWFRANGHLVEPEDIADILESDVDTCIIGTGAYGLMRVSDKVKSDFKSRNIPLVIEKTEEACRRYNQLKKTYKNVAAALHLTC